MATIPLMGNPVKLPDYNMSDTFVNIARLKAYEQQQRMEELKLGQTQRTLDREDLWRQVWGDVMTPGQPTGGTRGLAGAPPGGATAPPPGGVPPLQGAAPPLTMAQQIPPAAQGTYANTGMPSGVPASGMPTAFGTAPIDLQSRAGLGGLAGVTPTGQPPLMNVGRPAAPVQPPGGVPPATGPLPGQPPADQGLGAKQPGLPDMPGLMLHFNQDALRRAYAIDPERTMKAYNDQVEMHGKKLEHAEKQNELVYNTLSALEQSPNPAEFYPMALQSLRDKGVAVPASFPKEYDPALVRFKIREHEGMKERLNNARIQLAGAQSVQAGTQSAENIAKTQKTETENRLLPQEYELKRQNAVSEIQRRLEQTTDDTEKRKLEAERNLLDAMKVDATKGQNIRSAEQTAMAHVDRQLQPYKDVRDAMARIRTGAKGGDPASDMALSYAFIKLLDTQTGVRNEEQKDLAHKSGLPGKLREWMGAATGSSQLSSTMRQQLLATAERINSANAADYEYQTGQYREMFTRQGLDPNNIITDYSSPQPTRQTPEGKRQASRAPEPSATPAQPRLLSYAELEQVAKERSAKTGTTVTVEDVKLDLDPKKFRTQ